LTRRRIEVKADDDPEHLDFIAMSAHKMYAPFGAGALIGPRALFQQGEPEYRGGGAIEVVTGDDVLWADAPDRDEPGSPNVIGALAMAVAARTLVDLDRVGVISFNLASRDHGLVAAILGYEGGSGVRSGCFCAQQYVAYLLGLTPADEDRRCRARRAGLPWPKPGMVRASFGLYNTFEEVDILVDMLHRIARGDYRGTYEPRHNGAEYVPTRAI
jgi:cysteine desulfurase/selenocysteine lyase